MSSMQERELAFEAKFAHDEEMQFKLVARRNRLFGLWVAQRLGLDGQPAQDYARSVVAADLKEPGDQDVLAKVSADLENAGHQPEHPELENQLALCLDQARKELSAAAKEK